MFAVAVLYSEIHGVQNGRSGPFPRLSRFSRDCCAAPVVTQTPVSDVKRALSVVEPEQPVRISTGAIHDPCLPVRSVSRRTWRCLRDVVRPGLHWMNLNTLAYDAWLPTSVPVPQCDKSHPRNVTNAPRKGSPTSVVGALPALDTVHPSNSTPHG